LNLPFMYSINNENTYCVLLLYESNGIMFVTNFGDKQFS